ncbi:hypothetical protein ACE0DR_18205 [Azotobacter sp. CWF10]
MNDEQRSTVPKQARPSIAPEISPYGVAAFGKGVAIACRLRLVWADFRQQRNRRNK